MKNKKIYHFVYKTTNLVNGKIYIGVHSTKNINDSYLGSGKRLNDAIKSYGSENFKREILEFFETREKAYNKEAELVTTDFVKREDTYNITEGGYGVRTHSEKGLKILSEYAKKRAIMKTPSGKIVKVERDSEIFKSGKLVGHTKGKVVCLNENNEILQVSQDEFRKGNFVGSTKNIVVAKNVDGKILTVKQEEFNQRTDFVGITKGTITVKDKDGNSFRVSQDDPRFLSGEFVGVAKGNRFKQKNPQKKIECPHCGKSGIKSNMLRWHFDNCKFKINKI
jgi:hypothetical protein